MSLVASYFGITLAGGRLSVPVRNLMNLFGLATSVNSTDRHVRLLSAKPFADFDKLHKELTAFLVEKKMANTERQPTTPLPAPPWPPSPPPPSSPTESDGLALLLAVAQGDCTVHIEDEGDDNDFFPGTMEASRASIRSYTSQHQFAWEEGEARQVLGSLGFVVHSPPHDGHCGPAIASLFEGAGKSTRSVREEVAGFARTLSENQLNKITGGTNMPMHVSPLQSPVLSHDRLREHFTALGDMEMVALFQFVMAMDTTRSDLAFGFRRTFLSKIPFM